MPRKLAAKEADYDPVCPPCENKLGEVHWRQLQAVNAEYLFIWPNGGKVIDVGDRTAALPSQGGVDQLSGSGRQPPRTAKASPCDRPYARGSHLARTSFKVHDRGRSNRRALACRPAESSSSRFTS